ncbi:MAG: FxLYD domain-containing protein [Clostridia bacterium]
MANVKENKRRGSNDSKTKIDFKKLGIIAGAAVASLAVVVVIGVTVFGGDKIEAKKVVKGQKLEVVDTNLTFKDGITQVKATVANKSNEKKTNVSLKMTFLDKDNKEIAVMRGYVGDLEKGKSGDINAGITKNITDAADVKYEIIVGE